MSTGDSFETRFEKIDNLLRDPKSEVNSDCLLVSSSAVLFCLWGDCVCLPLAFSLVICERRLRLCIVLGNSKTWRFAPEESWSTPEISRGGPVYHGTDGANDSLNLQLWLSSTLHKRYS